MAKFGTLHATARANDEDREVIKKVIRYSMEYLQLKLPSERFKVGPLFQKGGSQHDAEDLNVIFISNNRDVPIHIPSMDYRRYRVGKPGIKKSVRQQIRMAMKT